jgi:hypothetical protein
MAKPISKANQFPTLLPKIRKEKQYDETKILSLHSFSSIE